MTPSRREALWGLVFICPWIFGFLVFTVGPLIASLVLSFTDFNLVRPEDTRFIGLDNYVRMASDPLVIQGLLVTVKFALIAIPATMLASLGDRRCSSTARGCSAGASSARSSTCRSRSRSWPARSCGWGS